MDLIHFIVFACIVYIAIVLGRMSMKNDMRRRFASIGGVGQKFPDVTTVINYVLKLRDQVEKLEHDNQALNNSLNIARAGSEKLERDYKVRGLAVGVANLSETYIEQLDLFNVNNNKKNNVKVQKTIDEIRKKYGDNSIIYADDIKN